MAHGEGSEEDLLDDGEVLADAAGEGRVHRLLVRELGEEIADAFARARATQEHWARERHPNDGLRERKKRLTRQQISDAATALFVVRGFENVRVSEIAEIVGVSEKTVYNYFPTKESLVFDRAEEGIARLTAALRRHDPGASPTKAIVDALSEDVEELASFPDEMHMFLPVFAEMIASTPALRGASLELEGRLVEVARTELAARADVDPRDPEPMIAARAIVGLQEVSFASCMRHIEDGLRGEDLRHAVSADLERATRLLDTGLWSFNLLTQGARTRQQLRDAATATEEARKQVMEALKQARAAWRELGRNDHGDRGRERQGLKREREGLKREREGLKRERQGLKRVLREAQAATERAAYEAFREMLRDRHVAIRERQDAIRERHEDPAGR
jgi:AcrR family transcriptional regulator